jgi:putative flippase GtrA
MNPRMPSPKMFKRWLVFNLVGALGVLVQMSVLLLLTFCFQIGYLPATALAVEAAVLHNYFWHERWTWADRVEKQDRRMLRRILSFHLTNGAMSMVGNLLLMGILVGKLHWNYLAANAVAILFCSILNFAAGETIVFSTIETHSKKGATDMAMQSRKKIPRLFFRGAALFLLMSVSSTAAELHPESLESWKIYVEKTEGRIAAELSSGKGFLALDFQESQDAARERQSLLSGQIPVRQLETQNDQGRSISVPDARIHHWRGSIFIPGATLDRVYSRLQDPKEEDTRQEDVLASRILERAPGQHKMYLKLQRSNIVTVIYNTEHLVRYQKNGEDRASSSSIATKIAEIERLGAGNEREKPIGHDRGFLWRMNSYWRYQQINGGVIVECESITLSRSIPFIFEPVARPIIKHIARESMQRTLQSMRTRLETKSRKERSTSEASMVSGPERLAPL